MPDRYTEVVILCEDLRQLQFVRRFLIRRGVARQRIRARQAPQGRGSGEQFVREQFPVEVQSLRKRPFILAGLIAVIDCDSHAAAERVTQLSQSLRNAGEEALEDSERVALLTPRRNIETWLFHLLGNEADEFSDYKMNVADRDLPAAVVAFATRCERDGLAAAPETLRAACATLRAFLANQRR